MQQKTTNPPPPWTQKGAKSLSNPHQCPIPPWGGGFNWQVHKTARGVRNLHFLFTILNWPLILISLSYHENREQPASLRNRHATRLFGSDGFENLDFVLNKAAEISIRVFSFFFIFLFNFFFVISAGFLHREPFYFLCRFRYRRNKTACCILWHSLSKFALSLRSEFSRHPEGLTF